MRLRGLSIVHRRPVFESLGRERLGERREPLFTDEKRASLCLYGRQVFHGCIGLSASHKVGVKDGRGATNARPCDPQRSELHGQ